MYDRNRNGDGIDVGAKIFSEWGDLLGHSKDGNDKKGNSKCMLFGEGSFLLLEKIMTRKTPRIPSDPEVQKQILPLLNRLCENSTKLTGTQKRRWGFCSGEITILRLYGVIIHVQFSRKIETNQSCSLPNYVWYSRRRTTGYYYFFIWMKLFSSHYYILGDSKLFKFIT